MFFGTKLNLFNNARRSKSQMIKMKPSMNDDPIAAPSRDRVFEVNLKSL